MHGIPAGCIGAMILEKLEPRHAWEIFETVFASTPRPSNHEERIRARIVDWARQHAGKGITHAMDKAGNVIVKKRASPGCEGWPAVLLQGHMDMVCEADRKDFDFMSQSIPLRIDPDGEWISADGTTLGADNGIGASIALALLIDDDPAFLHGPIEVLLTVAEETGLDGAYQLDPAALGIESKHLINVDSEELGIITIGSAGGGDVKLDTPVQHDPGVTDQRFSCFELTVAGLRGGHSGVDIHLPRGNAIKIVARLLATVLPRVPLYLSEWEGGTRRNAIPRSSTARFAVLSREVEALQGIIAAESASIEKYFKGISSDGTVLEPGITISLERIKMARCTTAGKTAEIVHVLHGLPSGPARYSPAMPTLVETSSNLAIVHASAGSGMGEFIVSARSNVDAELESHRRSIAAIGKLPAWDVALDDAYPAWTPEPGSTFLQFVRDRYASKLGQPVDIRAVHAGLECSVLVKKIPALAARPSNIVSIGPDVENPHSPAERARIAGVQLLYDVLKDILSNANRLT